MLWVCFLVVLLFLMELNLDDVLLGKAFIPGQWLHSVDNDSFFTPVTVDLGPFTNEFLVIVADVVGLNNFEHINNVVDQWEEIIPYSGQYSSHSEASIFFIKAPVLNVITDLLHLAFCHVLVPQVKECFSSISHLLVSNSAEVIFESIMKVVDWFSFFINPVTEASLTDEITFTIQSFNASNMDCSDETSPEFAILKF